ncbi:MAG: sporulation inhibitor of replication protein SirA [Bacilli bacterium]|nr:sporulation inhibitor of replication protein SirA [Bacilli bacterium]
MSKYVFLRINDKFRDFFKGNKEAFLELYYRRDESVFYKEQFKMFLEKNNKKEIKDYLIKSLGIREDISLLNDKIILENKYDNNEDILETYDNYLLMNSVSKNSPFKRHLLEYDSNFIIIDLNNAKIETCYL